jgi:hydroxyacylglutathione hydrolase
MLKVTCHVCGPLENNVYVLEDPDSLKAALVDPGIESEPVFDYIENNKLVVELILLTHGHFDHVFSLAEAKRRYDAPIAVHRAALPWLTRLTETAYNWGIAGAEPAPPPDIELDGGESLDLAGNTIQVIHTPGHSPGQVAFYTGTDVLVGDTLFKRSVGRWDLPGADWDALESSIRDKLFALPDETTVWPGHGEPTTIGEEKRLNPFLGSAARLRPKL